LTQLSSVDLVIDCGANAGLYTCLAASRGVSVMAIEPYPLCLSILYRNLRDNAFKVPIEVYPMALGDQAGVAPLYGRGQGASLLAGWGGLPTFDTQLVSVIPLDALVGRRFDGKRILLKVDVEGGEWNLLKGATQVLAQRPHVLMELSFSKNQPTGRHPHFREILDLFWGLKYTLMAASGPRGAALITPSRVDAWFARGAADLPSENIWCVPL
ncbi:MAG: FkbM family methyltransferase, partial [Myxococcales bacterium]